jgi:hypothetical protein
VLPFLFLLALVVLPTRDLQPRTQPLDCCVVLWPRLSDGDLSSSVRANEHRPAQLADWFPSELSSQRKKKMGHLRFVSFTNHSRTFTTFAGDPWVQGVVFHCCPWPGPVTGGTPCLSLWTDQSAAAPHQHTAVHLPLRWTATCTLSHPSVAFSALPPVLCFIQPA